MNLLSGLNSSQIISKIINKCLNIKDLDISFNHFGDIGSSLILD